MTEQEASWVLQIKQDVADLKQDVKTCAKNLCWMADRVHQAYHVNEGNDVLNWKECNQGVCGSMEHMLAQVGLDKDLQPAIRRP